MTNVVVAGTTPTSLHFLRQSLGQPTVEVVGLVTDDPDEVAYAFVHDSAVTRFRGTATREADSLVLAGRHGRGGLRHDHIPLYASLDEALGNDRHVDCVVVAEGWPDLGEALDTPVVRLDVDVPDPLADVVARVGEALAALAPVTHLFVTAVGGANPGETERDLLWARRGNRAGLSSRPGGGVASLECQVVGDAAERVVVSSVFAVFGEPITEEAVRRRLRSAGRNSLADSVRQEEGPVGTFDVLGSSASVLDLGSLQVTSDAVSLALFTDPLAARTRLALAQVSGSARPADWRAGTVPQENRDPSANTVESA